MEGLPRRLLRRQGIPQLQQGQAAPQMKIRITGMVLEGRVQMLEGLARLGGFQSLRSRGSS